MIKKAFFYRLPSKILRTAISVNPIDTAIFHSMGIIRIFPKMSICQTTNIKIPTITETPLFFLLKKMLKESEKIYIG